MKYVFLLFCIVAATITVNSQTIKMTITGVTPAGGEEVIAFEVSDTLPGSIGGGGGGTGTGVPRFEFVKFKKLPGQSTNELFRRSLAGTVMPQVDFDFYNSSNILFYKIVIKDVFVRHFSYLSPECSNCSSLSHQVWLDYVRIEVTDIATGNVVKYNRSANAFYN